MRKLLLLALVFMQAIWAGESLDRYFSYIDQLAQPKGDCREGEIEVAIDPLEIGRIEKVQEERLLRKGFSIEDAREFSRVGVVREDQYWIWLRDAVYFPKGIPGTYDRLLWKNTLANPTTGVAVLPLLPSGDFVLNLNYRHATRSWELELPRGAVEPEESALEAAMREVKEETGFVASSLTFLGEMAPDTGALSSVVPVFLGRVGACEAATPEYSEAIAALISFTKEELQQGVVAGFLEVEIDGKRKKVPLRDPFLTFALLQAELRRVL